MADNRNQSNTKAHCPFCLTFYPKNAADLALHLTGPNYCLGIAPDHPNFGNVWARHIQEVAVARDEMLGEFRRARWMERNGLLDMSDRDLINLMEA
jgi:hypothetical protein